MLPSSSPTPKQQKALRLSPVNMKKELNITSKNFKIWMGYKQVYEACWRIKLARLKRQRFGVLQAVRSHEEKHVFSLNTL